MAGERDKAGPLWGNQSSLSLVFAPAWEPRAKFVHSGRRERSGHQHHRPGRDTEPAAAGCDVNDQPAGLAAEDPAL